ncbi:MAG: hypothetical protein EZS28_011399 [Streblomastix strix]|uniref:Uncharacterized protein n=1 Tax=Streblomastix strix TaxID=222440 RepID=A0A5J4WEF7_9EUKA|nr:MAG: hypothetical protein EZS28_011399 [Streblomastix strix]
MVMTIQPFITAHSPGARMPTSINIDWPISKLMEKTPILVQGTNSLNYTLVIFEKVTITGCSAQQSSALYFSISFDNFDHSLPSSRPMNLQIIDSSIIRCILDCKRWFLSQCDRLSKHENNGLQKVEAKLYDDGYESEGKWFKVKEQDVITPVVVDIPSETKKKLNTTSIVIIVVFSVIALIALLLAALSIMYCFYITKKKDKDNKQTKVKQIEIKDSTSEVSVKTVSNEEEEEFAQLVIERDQLIFNNQQSVQRQKQQHASQNQKYAQRKVTRYKKTDFQAIIQEAELENEKDEKDLRLSRKKPVQSRNLTSKSAAISVQATDEYSVGRYSSESMSEVVQRKQEVEEEEERQD